jgi:hypothetical protein
MSTLNNVRSAARPGPAGTRPPADHRRPGLPAPRAATSAAHAPPTIARDGPRPRVGVVREQARMVLGDVEHDRARLEQRKIAFLIGRNQAERMKAQMRGLRPRTQRNKANLVGLAHLFKRPANARIARQALPAIGRPLKGGDDDRHRETPLRFSSAPRSTSAGPTRDRNSAATSLRIERSARLAVRVMRVATRPTSETHRWRRNVDRSRLRVLGRRIRVAPVRQ